MNEGERAALRRMCCDYIKELNDRLLRIAYYFLKNLAK